MQNHLRSHVERKLQTGESVTFADDLLNREPVAEVLLRTLGGSDTPISIMLNAPWGAGKTTFVKMLIDRLHKNGSPVVYVDAFANDFAEDPFLVVVEHILAICPDPIADGLAGQEFRKSAARFAARVAKATGRFAVRAAVGSLGLDGNAVGEAASTTLAEFGSEQVDDAAAVIEADLLRRLEQSRSTAQFVKDFKQRLRALAAELSPSNVSDPDGFPLLIIVDELDRCRPDFAVEMLERTKHLLDVSGVAFVFSVNRDALCASIRGAYGESYDAHEYLFKFFNAVLRLPPPSPSSDQSHQYARSLLSTSTFKDSVDEYTQNVFCLAAHALGLELRQIEVVGRVLLAGLSETVAEHKDLRAALVLLAMIECRDRSLFCAIRDRSIDPSEFISRMQPILDLQSKAKILSVPIHTLVVLLALPDPVVSGSESRSIKQSGSAYDIARLELSDLLRIDRARDALNELCRVVDVFSSGATPNAIAAASA